MGFLLSASKEGSFNIPKGWLRWAFFFFLALDFGESLEKGFAVSRMFETGCLDTQKTRLAAV